MTTSIALTQEQQRVMESNSDWLKLTPEQHKFMQEIPEGDVVGLRDGVLFYVASTRIESAMEKAFKSAANDAIAILSIEGGMHGNQVETITYDPLDFGQTYIRVTVTDCKGAKASAIGMIPDPRPN